MGSKALIGGAPESGELRAVVSPWSGEPVSEAAFCDTGLLQQALEASEVGFQETKSLPRHERVAVLERMADLVEERSDSLAATIQAEAGKPVQYAAGEVARCAGTLRRFAEATRSYTDPAVPLDAVPAAAGRTGLLQRFPVGPILGITPFNFPLNLVAHKVAPAVATGCSFVIKPAEQTPTSAIQLGEIALEAGYPEPAVSVVPADRQVVGGLVESDIPRLLSFTGSARVGWELKARAGRKKVTLELGGNAAAIVHSDADLAVAMGAIASAAMAYAGQVCISVQRVLIHASRYDEAREALIDCLASVATGDPSLPETVCGPLINPAAKKRLESWVSEACSSGAQIAFSQPAHPNPRVLAPMALEGVNPTCSLYAEEAFGPVVLLEPYSTIEEAIARTNQGRWGLQTGLFTHDLRVVFEAYNTLEVGALFHNDVPTRRVDHMPYGGVKDSGLGREGPRWAMDDYTEPRMLSLNWGSS